jgi:predicted dehydrogenase
MTLLNRRQFGRRAAKLAAASSAFSLFTIAGTKASGRVIGANDTIRLAIAGINGRGGSHIAAFGEMKNVQITYLVDPDTRLHASRAADVNKLNHITPKTITDIRQALDDKELDGVTVATCNHWHSLITIWACQADKDVYVEKPISHNVHEGRIAVEMARHHKRIVQHGTQNRSSAGVAQMISAAQSGKYGKLEVSTGFCHKPRWSIGVKPIEAPPKGLDFNLWLGPAAEQPYHANLVHYNWHWFWDFGNGDVGNQGVHQMDIARWAIQGSTLPKSVVSFGGRFGYQDQGQTPNTELTLFDYGDAKLAFETCGLVKGKSHAPDKVTNEFQTSEGVIAGGRFYRKGEAPDTTDEADVATKDGKRKNADKKDAKKQRGERLAKFPATQRPGSHFANFIAAMRSRKEEDLNAGVEIAHYSAALCHLANISYRTGREMPYAEAKQQLAGDAHTAELFDAMTFNLAKGNDIKVEDLQIRVGPKLAFDAASERFKDSDAANALLTRSYRAPFNVPDKVS